MASSTGPVLGHAPIPSPRALSLGGSWLALAVGALALVVGVASAAVTPLVVGAALAGLVVFAIVLARPFAGLLLFFAVVGTLPFGVVPVRLGVQVTFIDVTLIVTTLGLLCHVLFRSRERLRPWLGTPGLIMVLFCIVAVAAFLVGTGLGATPAEQTRRFAKLLGSLLFFLVAANLLKNRIRLVTVTRVAMVAGAVAGAVAAALWLLPRTTQLSLLTSLRVLGYPTSDVLRFVPGPNQTYTDQLRATGTAVDPNVLGGTTMLTLCLIAVQWMTRGRVLSRPVLLLLVVPTVAGLLASFSRSSWLGVVAGLVFLGTLRQRRIWIVLVAAVGTVLVSPVGQTALTRLVSGFSAADPATAYRLGEYRNALTIIQRYPLLGIGFGSSPDIDVSAGVSSMYLLVAEQMGIVGLAIYLALLGSTLLVGVRALRRMQDEQLQGILGGFVAAFAAALLAGLFDHYFANLAFPHAVALLWLYGAVLVAGARIAADEQRASTKPVPRSTHEEPGARRAGSGASPPPR